MILSVATLAVALVIPGAAAGPPLPRRVNAFKLEHAATAAIAETFSGSLGPALLLTTFGPIGKDAVLAVPSIAGLLSNGSVPTPIVLDAEAKWPNMASWVPPGTLGPAGASSPTVLEAGGFFVSPAKATGEVVFSFISY